MTFVCSAGGEPSAHVEDERRRRNQGLIALVPFLLIVAVVAMLGASITQTGVGSWYDELAKPPWQPPSWVFGPGVDRAVPRDRARRLAVVA